ncbi:MAG: hypothetical protein AB1411_16515 [Nitrospirota bacterium]
MGQTADRNDVMIAGIVQWIGDREVRNGQPPSQQYGILCVKPAQARGDRGESVRIPILVYGDPLAVQKGDRILVQGRLAWHVDERNGLRMGCHVVRGEEVRILARAEPDQPGRAPAAHGNGRRPPTRGPGRFAQHRPHHGHGTGGPWRGRP